MNIYLAHPIDFANGEIDPAFYDMVRALLLEAGASSIYSPAMAWRVGDAPMPAHIQEVNLQAMLKCDAMLAILPTGTASLGVPFEMGICYGAGIPTVLVRGDDEYGAFQARAGSALLSFLSSMPIFGVASLSDACVEVVQMAWKYRMTILDAREGQGEATEGTGE